MQIGTPLALEGPPAREITADLEHLAHGLNPAQGAYTIASPSDKPRPGG